MNKFNKLARKGRGFTLLEMIIVLSVVAILLSWGLPSVTQSLQNNQVAAQSNELVSMMHFAKSESLRRNADVPILLGSSADGWSAIVEDPAELADVVGCVPGQLRCVSNTGVVLTAAVTQVVFNNRGYIRKAADPWTPETMYVQHSRCTGNNQRRRIDITPTGQISACSLPCDSTAACP